MTEQLLDSCTIAPDGAACRRAARRRRPRARRAGRSALSRAASLDSVAAVPQPRPRAPAARVDAAGRRALPRDDRTRLPAAAARSVRRLARARADEPLSSRRLTDAGIRAAAPDRHLRALRSRPRRRREHPHPRAGRRAAALGHDVCVFGASSAPLAGGELALGACISLVIGGTETGFGIDPRAWWRRGRAAASARFDVLHLHEPLMPLRAVVRALAGRARRSSRRSTRTASRDIAGTAGTTGCSIR